jgi:hypothetical protein
MKQRQVLLGSLIYFLVVTLFLIFSNGLLQNRFFQDHNYNFNGNYSFEGILKLFSLVYDYYYQLPSQKNLVVKV